MIQNHPGKTAAAGQASHVDFRFSLLPRRNRKEGFLLMKSLRFAHLLFSTVLSLGLVGCGISGGSAASATADTAAAGTAAGASSDAAWKTLHDAYVYTFPLVIMRATMDKMTNTVTATSTQAPVNQLIHAAGLATAESRSVVTPNVDTVYTQLCLDLRQDAVVMEKPAAGRFFSFEVLDAYTNCVQVLGTGGDGDEARTYLFTGPNFAGAVPAGMTRVALPTSMAWVIGRTLCAGQDDLANVRAIQSKMRAMPLAQYQRGDTAPAQGSYDPARDFVPVEHVLGLSPADYFTLANELLADNPPADADAPLMAELKTISVGPGLSFDPAVLGDPDAAAARWKAMLRDLRAELNADSQQYMSQNGVWSFFGSPIAEFGTAYEYLALVALAGLGANPVSVALYPKTGTDSAGAALTGAKRYVLHFDAGALPPVAEGGFWSVTAYRDADDLLIDNPIDRYCINDRSPFVKNADGSLDLYLQSDPPADPALAPNWLPTGTEGFHLYLRIYLPGKAVLDGSWSAPSINVAA